MFFFAGVKFRAKFEVGYKNNFRRSLWITGYQLIFSTVKWVTEREEIPYLYSTKILLNTEMISEVYSTAIDSFLLHILRREKHRIKRHWQRRPNNLSQLQNTQLNLLTVTFLAI